MDFTSFARVVVDCDRHVDLILRLAARGQAWRAYRLLKMTPRHVLTGLCGRIGHDSRAVRTLAEALEMARESGYAGRMFELSGAYGDAARNFERAQDWDRAQHCFRRCGDHAAVKRLARRAGAGAFVLDTAT
jgi:hypothetical protein